MMNERRAPKVKSSWGQIVWAEMEAKEIYNRWRAVGESVGCWAQYQDKKVKLIHIICPESPLVQDVLPEENNKHKPGTMLLNKKHGVLSIKAAKDSWVHCSQLQFESRRVLSALDFANGIRLQASSPSFFVDPVASPSS